MKITIDRNTNPVFLESQWPVYTIDTALCHSPYAIRRAIESALELDGHSKEDIAEVMNRMPDTFQGGTGINIVATPPSVFSKEVIEKIQEQEGKVRADRYFLGTHIQGAKFAYCLMRETNGVRTVVLSNEYGNKESFDHALATITLLYNPTVISEEVNP